LYFGPSQPNQPGRSIGHDDISETIDIMGPTGILRIWIPDSSLCLMQLRSPQRATDPGRSVHPRSPHPQLPILGKLGSSKQSSCIRSSINIGEHQVSNYGYILVSLKLILFGIAYWFRHRSWIVGILQRSYVLFCRSRRTRRIKNLHVTKPENCINKSNTKYQSCVHLVSLKKWGGF
jgi:hypothetical protein